MQSFVFLLCSGFPWCSSFRRGEPLLARVSNLDVLFDDLDSSSVRRACRPRNSFDLNNPVPYFFC
jgi:hypothetical protein